MKNKRIRFAVRLILVSGMTLFCTALFAQTPPVNTAPRTLTEYRVVGYTAATDGAIQTADASLTGVAAMHSLCADVDPNARAAFSDEAIRSPAVEGAPAAAWIIPARTEVLFRPDVIDSRDWIAVDGVSGVLITGGVFGNPQPAIAAAACLGYTSNISYRAGLILEPASGRVLNQTCNNSVPIACSAPIVVPISP